MVLAPLFAESRCHFYLYFFSPILSFLLVFSLEVPDNTGASMQWCGSSNTQLEGDPSCLSLEFNAHFVMLPSLALCAYINIARDIACPRSIQCKLCKGCAEDSASHFSAIREECACSVWEWRVTSQSFLELDSFMSITEHQCSALYIRL